jgi:hypothetical protein
MKIANVIKATIRLNSREQRSGVGTSRSSGEKLGREQAAAMRRGNGRLT